MTPHHGPNGTLNEEDYIDRIRATIGRQDEKMPVSAEALTLVEEALASHPVSAELWCLRGDLIQASDDDNRYDLQDCVRSYERALDCNPGCAEAYESIGYYFDAVDVDLPRAEAAFRKAIGLGAGADSHVGLARVLAEMGRRKEALDVLSCERCMYASSPEVRELRREIVDGVWNPK